MLRIICIIFSSLQSKLKSSEKKTSIHITINPYPIIFFNAEDKKLFPKQKALREKLRGKLKKK